MAAVEAAEHEPLFRQAAFVAGEAAVGDRPRRAVRLVADRQVNDLLVVVPLLIHRQGHRIADDIVDEVGTHAADITEIVRLDGRGAMSQHAGARAPRVSAEVHKDVDLVADYRLRRCNVRQILQLDETVAGGSKLAAYRAAIIRPQIVADDLEPSAVMALQQVRDQIRQRMLAKIPG